MLNREAVAQQLVTPTRRVIDGAVSAPGAEPGAAPAPAQLALDVDADR
jgi:hypothetical protein